MRLICINFWCLWIISCDYLFNTNKLILVCAFLLSWLWEAQTQLKVLFGLFLFSKQTNVQLYNSNKQNAVFLDAQCHIIMNNDAALSVTTNIINYKTIFILIF